jgi:diguanylate cyclase (GGDEF)-like protein
MTPFERLPKIGDAVLTREPAIRFQLGLWLTSVISCVLYAGIMQMQVELGLAPASGAYAMYSAMALANTVFYVGLRRGWAQKFKADPGLGMTQLFVGIVFFWWTYALAGRASGVTLMIMSSHMVYSVFTMPPRRVMKLAIGSLLALGVLMLACGHLDPERFAADVQVVGFLYAVLVVLLIARLAKTVTAMNERLRSQRTDLEAALKRVQELATKDDLTSLHNRRHMTELMGLARQQHARSISPCCIALLDVDFFKNVNDRYGHHAGDEVLRALGVQAKANFRESDLVGRWGGEEFLVMFPNTPVSQAELALDRLRERLLGVAFDGVAEGLRVTFSAGLAVLAPAEMITQCVDRADKAMYRAKAGGRNRTVCDESAEPPDTPSEPGSA